MAAIDVFDLLSLLERRKLIEITSQNSTYCACCGKKHFRNWYTIQRTGDEFYVCLPAGSGMTKRSGGSSNWDQITLLDLLNQIIP